MSTAPEKKSGGRGCFLYGCLSLVAVFILGLVLVVVGVRHYINSTIEQFTAAEPETMEPATLPEAEMRQLQERLRNFGQALQQTNEAAQLSLETRELNAVIATETRFNEVKDRLRVELQDDGMVCRVSLPLDPLSNLIFLSRLKGRHLNATLNVQVTVANGVLQTSLKSATVKGTAIPPELLARLEEKLPWQEIQQNPEIQEALARLGSLKIRDGRLELETQTARP